MLFPSSKALIHRYKEMRLYATEVLYARNDEPRGLFVFLQEHNTETHLAVARCLKKKQLRSRNETLYWIELSSGDTLLLLVDHARGNDYVHCTRKTYERLCARVANGSWMQTGDPVAESAAARDDVADPQEDAPVPGFPESFAPEHYAGKIIFADASVLFLYPETVETLLARNEVVVSPYYQFDLETLGREMKQPQRAAAIASEYTERWKTQYSDRFISELYVDQDRPPRVNPAAEHDYLFALARQQKLSPSQVLFLTTDEEFARRMLVSSYEAHRLERPEAQPSEDPGTVAASSGHSAKPSEASSFPPRSQRNAKKKGSFWSNMANSIRIFF